MRAVSIALVLFAHCAGTPHAYSLHGLDETGEIGVFGVKVFFVISGFLITSLLLTERKKTGAISLKKFYLRRVLRIFPEFYTFLAAAFVLAHSGALTIPDRDFVHSVTFTANLFPISWELLHIWSLSVEEQFYLFWPASLVLFGSRLPLRITLILVVIPPLFFGFALHGHTRLGQAISGLAAGCVLAGSRSILHENEQYMRILSSRWTVGWLICALSLMESFRRFWFFELLAGLVSVGIALLLDAVMTFDSSLAGRFLNWRPVAYLGLLSYSIYLWQQIFLNRWGQSWFNVFPVNLLCVFACALVSFHLIEKPVLKLKNRFRPGPLPAAHPATESEAQIA